MATHLMPAGDTIHHRPSRGCPCNPDVKRRMDWRRLRRREVITHHRTGSPSRQARAQIRWGPGYIRARYGPGT